MTWHRRFFWILLALLPTQLGLHFWPDWAMVLGRRVDYLSPTIYLTDILILFTVGSYIMFNLKFEIFNKKTFILLLFVAVNIFFAPNQPVAMYKWLKVLEFSLLGWYIIKTKPAFVFIIYHLSFGILFSSVLAIAQFILQHSVGGPLWWLGERTFDINTPGIARIDWFGRELLRPYATFPHPNVLGGFLATLLPLFIVRKKWPVVLFGAIALLMTFSRSAIIVGLLAVAWTQIKNKKVFFILVVAVLLFTSRFSLFTSSDESFVVRQQLNTAAVTLWQQSPLGGVGLGNFLVKLPETLPSRAVYFLQPVHNIYLLILSETGIVGFLILIWFLRKVLRPPFGIWHLAFGILLVLGLLDHYPLTLQQGQLLLTIFVTLSIRGSSRVRYRSDS